ncbi:hypothetical protein [Saccharopolyspora rosea]|uniref:hypothetical protein n=1 Tax=Saccharopolyspora rosea TaxID=524884 RepID=UPI0021DAD7DC|nr:hypothetical protein [Saccharopolyspora rosea]
MTGPYGPPPYPQQGQPPPGYGPPSGPVPQPYPGTPQQGRPYPGAPQGMPPQGGFPPPQGAGPLGQPMAPPPPGMGRVVLDYSYMPLAFVLALFKPSVTINGRPMRGAWSRTPVDLPPGQHHIQVHVNYLWKFGHATAVVPVGAGQQVDVFYRAPAVAFGGGAIGPQPQQTPNLGLAIGMMVGVFVLWLLLILLLV